MAITSPLPYFILMPLFVGIAYWISKIFPFYRREIRQVQSERLSSLEGLRGVLALSVFFCHAAISYTYLKTGRWEASESFFYDQMGKVPVRLFFILSGFLFWTKLSRLKPGQKFSALRFYMDRCKRILPLWWFSVLIITLIVFARSGFHLRVTPETLLTEIFNWVRISIPGGVFSPINGDLHTIYINAYVGWTLRWEWFLYFILPFLTVFTVGKRVFPMLLGFVAVNFLLKKVVAPLGVIPDGWMVTLVDLFHKLSKDFGFGMIASYLYLNTSLLKKFSSAAWGIVPLICLAFLFHPFQLAGFKLTDHGAAVLELVLFLFVLADHSSTRFLKTKAILLLGRISYSLYLMHAIILFVVTQTLNNTIGITGISPLGYWSFMGFIGILVVGICSLTFAVIEHPFIKKKKPAVVQPELKVLYQ